MARNQGNQGDAAAPPSIPAPKGVRVDLQNPQEVHTFQHISVIDINQVGVYLINGDLEAVAFFPHSRMPVVIADRDVLPEPKPLITPVSAVPAGGLIAFPNNKR